MIAFYSSNNPQSVQIRGKWKESYYLEKRQTSKSTNPDPEFTQFVCVCVCVSVCVCVYFALNVGKIKGSNVDFQGIAFEYVNRIVSIKSILPVVDYLMHSTFNWPKQETWSQNDMYLSQESQGRIYRIW